MKITLFVLVIAIGLSIVTSSFADLNFVQYENFGGEYFPDLPIVHQFSANLFQYEYVAKFLLEVHIEQPIKIFFDDNNNLKFEYRVSSKEASTSQSLALYGYKIRCLLNPEITSLINSYFEDWSNETHNKYIVVYPENQRYGSHVSFVVYAEYEHTYGLNCCFYPSDEEAQQYWKDGICFNQWVVQLFSQI